MILRSRLKRMWELLRRSRFDRRGVVSLILISICAALLLCTSLYCGFVTQRFALGMALCDAEILAMLTLYFAMAARLLRKSAAEAGDSAAPLCTTLYGLSAALKLVYIAAAFACYGAFALSHVAALALDGVLCAAIAVNGA